MIMANQPPALNATDQRIGRFRWPLRRWVQLVIFVLTLAAGAQFAVYVFQAGGLTAITVQRPPGVEGFLPIGALMGFKLFLTTGIWDPVHPAAMVILGFAVLISFGLRKSFCGWFCPVGALSEWMWRIGQRWFGRNFRLPVWADYPLRSIKYILLGFFVWVIFKMDRATIEAFIHSPYYQVSDVKMLHFFTRMDALTAGILTFLFAASVFIKNFWCRYLCPYGALMGILAFFGPTRIRRHADNCIHCGKCARQCPYHLPVDQKKKIFSPECSGCMDCVRVCPVPNTLELKTFGLWQTVWSTVSLAVVILGLFFGSIYMARVTGHWQGNVDDDAFRLLLQQVDGPEMTHPGIRGNSQ
jgi:polyferredoxin